MSARALLILAAMLAAIVAGMEWLARHPYSLSGEQEETPALDSTAPSGGLDDLYAKDTEAVLEYRAAVEKGRAAPAEPASRP